MRRRRGGARGGRERGQREEGNGIPWFRCCWMALQILIHVLSLCVSFYSSFFFSISLTQAFTPFLSLYIYMFITECTIVATKIRGGGFSFLKYEVNVDLADANNNKIENIR